MNCVLILTINHFILDYELVCDMWNRLHYLYLAADPILTTF